MRVEPWATLVSYDDACTVTAVKAPRSPWQACKQRSAQPRLTQWPQQAIRPLLVESVELRARRRRREAEVDAGLRDRPGNAAGGPASLRRGSGKLLPVMGHVCR